MQIAKGKKVKPTDLVKLRFDKPKKMAPLDPELVEKLKRQWIKDE